jgi:hypothetical protein
MYVLMECSCSVVKTLGRRPATTHDPLRDGWRLRVLSDLEVNHYPKVITGPDPMGRCVECQRGCLDPAVRLGMRVPGADEHIVHIFVARSDRTTASP